MSANETVREVCAEIELQTFQGMVQLSDVVDLRDRILAAHEREMAAKDAEIKRLNEKCDEYERQPEMMAETAKGALDLIRSQDARISLLERALKPVMECDTDFDICGAVECGEVELVSAPYDAVREARRIMQEGEEK